MIVRFVPTYVDYGRAVRDADTLLYRINPEEDEASLVGSWHE